MRIRTNPILVAATLLCLLPVVASAQVVSYSQDFESLNQADTSALSNDGWKVFATVFDTDGTTFLYNYGAFPAPNDGAAFCVIDQLQGGVDQGIQQLSVFSDYENTDHASGRFIETSVFQEFIIGAGNIGQTWEFSFQAKAGNIEGLSTAAAFIKTIESVAPFNQTNGIFEDMTAIPTTWGGWTISIDLTDPALIGQFLQIGFTTTATFYQGSGIFYDNLVFEQGTPTSVPDLADAGMALQQNYPNPFNPSTKIEFALDQPGSVLLAVYDLAGRRVATLEDGRFDSGVHTVVWNGRTDRGAFAASGRYNYVLETPEGRLSRGMTLLK